MADLAHILLSDPPRDTHTLCIWWARDFLLKPINHTVKSLQTSLDNPDSEIISFNNEEPGSLLHNHHRIQTLVSHRKQ